MNFTFDTTPNMVMHRGASTSLGKMLEGRFKRPILLTDKGLVDVGLVDPVMTSLGKSGFEVLLFDDVMADPPAAKVKQAVDAARAHDADGVIALGGGSSMDTAKIVAVLLDGTQKLEEIYGLDQVSGPRAPLVCIPTTAGTGSEVTSISVITAEDDTKVAVVDNALYPDLAVLDPDLTMGLPRPITAATGIDAMVHAIEAYTNINRKNPISDGLARHALSLLSANIVAACEQPDNKSARENMLLGSMLAGQAFANSPVGAVHGMAYPLGGIFHIPHGLSNSLMLEPVLRFNAPNATSQYAELSSVISPDASGNDAQRCDHFIGRVMEIVAATGVERQLSQLGIKDRDLPRMAEDAMKGQRVLQNNPRPVTYDDALSMYKSVL